MNEVAYTEKGILPLAEDGFYILRRGADKNLYLDYWTQQEARRMAKETAAQRNVPVPEQNWEIARLLYKSGVVINMYNVGWGEELYLRDAYSYNWRAYDIARAYIRTHTAKHYIDKLLSIQVPQRQKEPLWPWENGSTLDLAARAAIALINDSINQDIRAEYARRTNPNWCPKELLDQVLQTANGFLSYTNVEDDVKYVFLTYAEGMLKAGRPLTYWQWNALQTIDGERLLGHRYSDEEIRRYLGRKP